MKLNNTVFICFVFAFVLLFFSSLGISHASCWEVGGDNPYPSCSGPMQDCKTDADGFGYGWVCSDNDGPGPDYCYCHDVRCDTSCAGSSGGNPCPNGNADCNPTGDSPICCDGVCQASCGSNPDPNCKYLSVSSGQTNGYDASGNLILTVGIPYSLTARYGNAGKANKNSNHLMRVLPGYSGSDCNLGDLVFAQASGSQPDEWRTFSSWVPQNPGIYTVYCEASIAGYEACCGYKECKGGSQIKCQGPGAKMVVKVAVNSPPTCTISGNGTVPAGGTVALTGTGTDTDGSIASYGPWSATGGSVSPTTGTTTTWTAPNTVGSYTISLTVTDNIGATGSCSKVITTTNSPPTCTISGNGTVPAGGTVALTGTGTDTDGSIASYGPWSATGGSVSPTTGTTTTWTAPNTVGSYTISLTVTDNIGATGSCSKVITTTNSPPTCTISGNSSVVTGGTVALTGTGTDTDGTIASYLWSTSAGNGTVSPTTGTTTTWTAPATTGFYTINLKVTDNVGATGTCTKPIQVIPPAANNPPTCTISGASSVPAGTTAALTGTGTDTDGTIAMYSWSGTGGSFSPATGQNTTWTAPNTVGPYTVTLTVIDDDNATGQCTKVITVTNSPPTCTITGASSAPTGGAVALTGTGTDTDGTIASYAWTKSGGSLSFTAGPTTTWTAPLTTGSYTITLTVTDNIGAIGTCTKAITVVNTPPTCSISGASSVVTNGTVALTGTGTDIDGTIASYLWSTSAGNGTVSPTTGTTTTWTAPATTGFYTTNLKVTDNVGATGTCTKTIQVILSPNNPPTCTISGASSVAAGGTVALIGSGSDSDGTIAMYSWSGTGGSFSPATGTNTTWTSPTTVGSYTVTLTVIDDDNATGQCTKTISVTNPPPVCTSITANPTTVRVGGTVSLTATASDSNGTIASYAWSASGGAFSSTTTNPTTWTAPLVFGSYPISVIVTDDGGATASCPVAVVVVSPNTLPTCTSLTATPSTVYLSSGPATPITLVATASDTDGTISSYTWAVSPSGGSFLPLTGNPTVWTPPVVAGSYTISVTAIDNNGGTAVCPTQVVTVMSGYDLTVTTKLKPLSSAGNCSIGAALEGADVRVSYAPSNVLIGEKSSPASGITTFSNIKKDSDIYICPTYSPPGCTSYSLDANCPTVGAISVGCARVPPPAPAVTTLSLAYDFTKFTGGGWVTAIDGDVEANSLGDKIACLGFTGELNPPNGFKSYLLNFSDDGAGVTNPKAYAFSNSNGNTISTNNIIRNSSRGGWAFDLGSRYEYLKGLTYKSPGSWFDKVLTDSNTKGLYKMTASQFNSFLNSNSTYSLSCGASCNLGILYVEGSGSDKISFTGLFNRSGTPRLLIVTNVPVEIGAGVGVSSAALGGYPFPITATPNIEASIFSSKDISVLSNSSAEKVVMLQAPLVSMGNILFNRDVGLQNTNTPSEAVKYDPVFLCETSKLEKAHPEIKSYTGLGIFAVQWDYSE